MEIIKMLDARFRKHQVLVQECRLSDPSFKICEETIVLCDLFKEVDKQMLKSKYRKMREIEYQNGLIYPEFKECEDKLIEKYKKYRFITLNFDDEKLGTEVIKNLPKIINLKLKKKWIKSYTYSIEQRSDNPIFKGFHTHIIVEPIGNKKKSEIIREFYSSFKDIMKDKQKVDVRIFPETQLQDKISYIHGNKKDEKMSKVIIDRLMRKTYNIENIYTNNLEKFKLEIKS